MKVLFITSNRGKFEEARKIGEKYGVEVEWKREEYEEYQGNSLEEIAEKSAMVLSKKIGEPFFIEDSGLFIDALNGFPGPYSSYVFKTIGNEGILKLMEGKDNREARFIAVVAYFDGEKISTFRGEVKGEISKEMRGMHGFGYDPIFLYDGKTFAEMGDEKNKVSHRRKALENFFSSIFNQ